MSHDETIAAMQAELTRQDEVLAELEHALRTLGDVDLDVPAELLRELDAAVQLEPSPAVATIPTLFGALRA